MAHRIAEVEPGSIAEQCGLKPGDILRTINGEPVLDQIDYQFLSVAETLLLEVETTDGVFEEIELEKDENEPLGIVFESSLMSKPRVCANRCVFCFVDQMPDGMRDTLYVKDDDWRLSLMMGNYITLTNLSDREFDRIVARKASPLFISVHATDGEVRARMMKNPKAAGIMNQLTRLADTGISFHCQIVLCPGYNDGKVLDNTIETLSSMFPAARSMAVVPVGLTRYREGLDVVSPYTKETAIPVIEQIERWQEKLLSRIGTRFVFPSDEFYSLSGKQLPADETYEGYPQIENGVGLLRGFVNEFSIAYRHADMEEAKPRKVLIATGTSMADFLQKLIEDHPIPGVQVTVLPVKNHFFGTTVTVAGLLTATDLLPALKNAQADEVLISQAMLRHEGELFLDDVSLTALSSSLSLPVHAVDCDGAEFFYALLGEHYKTED